MDKKRYCAAPGSAEATLIANLAVGDMVEILMNGWQVRTAKVIKVLKNHVVTDDPYTTKFRKQDGFLVGNDNFFILPILPIVAESNP